MSMGLYSMALAFMDAIQDVIMHVIVAFYILTKYKCVKMNYNFHIWRLKEVRRWVINYSALREVLSLPFSLIYNYGKTDDFIFWECKFARI